MSANPYAPPQAGGPDGIVTAELVDQPLLWRKDKILVLHRKAAFPDRCIKTNAATTQRLKRKLVWHHPAYYFLLLISPVIYIIVALIVQKRATIRVGLSADRIRRRRRIIFTSWLLVLIGTAMVIGSIGWMNMQDNGAAVLVLGILMALFGALFGIGGARTVSAVRIEGDYVWLKGACHEFLAELPPWPYAR